MVNLPTAMAAAAEISANLPSDLVADIFTRLPVKSLSRFKCVSKSMYALLHDPNFIKKHLNRAIDKTPNLLLQIDFKSKLFSVADEKWDNARRLQLPFVSSLEKVELSGSCHGLICISDHIRNEDIFLCNPCTGLYKKLPIPKFDVPTIETTCFTALGFGYHRADDDYKVIRFVYLYDKPFKDMDSYECEARVYSLSTDKWKKIGDVPFHIASRAALWLGNEILAWKATWGFGLRMSTLIVSFNMDKEVFEEIPQPELKNPEECQIEIGTLDGCFTLYHIWRNEGVVVWSMKEYGVKESWTRLFVIGRPLIMGEFFMYLRPLWVMKNGEILIEKGGRGLILYDPKRKKLREVYIRGAPRRYMAITCVGSLVSPCTSRAEYAGA